MQETVCFSWPYMYLISSLHLSSASRRLQYSSLAAWRRNFSSCNFRARMLGFTSTCRLGSTFFWKHQVKRDLFNIPRYESPSLAMFILWNSSQMLFILIYSASIRCTNIVVKCFLTLACHTVKKNGNPDLLLTFCWLNECSLIATWESAAPLQSYHSSPNKNDLLCTQMNM